MAIDDFSRELSAAILPDKTQFSARAFLEQVLKECPDTIEHSYTDNGKEYQGDPRQHAFMLLCAEHHIEQRFTRVRTPRTNGKAEPVIRTLMALWHDKSCCESAAHSTTELRGFLNDYNGVGVRPHKGSGSLTPEAKLSAYFYPEKL